MLQRSPAPSSCVWQILMRSVKGVGTAGGWRMGAGVVTERPGATAVVRNLRGMALEELVVRIDEFGYEPFGAGA